MYQVDISVPKHPTCINSKNNMYMPKIRYRQTDRGMKFCCWDIQRQQFENCRVYFIHIHEGFLGDLNNANVELDPNPFELKKIEREIMRSYPIENLPLKEHQISITLKESFKIQSREELQRKLLRSIEWNLIHTGLGFKGPKYHWIDYTFVLRIRMLPIPKIKEILKADFHHWIPLESMIISERSY